MNWGVVNAVPSIIDLNQSDAVVKRLTRRCWSRPLGKAYTALRLRSGVALLGAGAYTCITSLENQLP
jgi:hypothetical protein